MALPTGVISLGWLCLGYPDERPPEPGLTRAGWSTRLSLGEVIISERWPNAAPEPPRDRIRAPARDRVVAARDDADSVLTPPGSLGRLDQAVDRVIACCGTEVDSGTLVLAAGDHPVADLGVTAYRRTVTAEVLAAARQGESIGVAFARTVGLAWLVVDAGTSTGNLTDTDAMSVDQVAHLVTQGRDHGARLAGNVLVLLGEVGIGNTTVAAALACVLRDADPGEIIGLGAGADSAMLQRIHDVVATAIARIQPSLKRTHATGAHIRLLAAVGGPEIAYLTGVVLGAASTGGIVVLDGMVTSVAAPRVRRGTSGGSASDRRSTEPGARPYRGARTSRPGTIARPPAPRWRGRRRSPRHTPHLGRPRQPTNCGSSRQDDGRVTCNGERCNSLIRPSNPADALVSDVVCTGEIRAESASGSRQAS